MVQKVWFKQSAGWWNRHTAPWLFQYLYPRFKAAGQVQTTKIEFKNHEVSAKFQKLEDHSVLSCKLQSETRERGLCLNSGFLFPSCPWLRHWFLSWHKLQSSSEAQAPHPAASAAALLHIHTPEHQNLEERTAKARSSSLQTDQKRCSHPLADWWTTFKGGKTFPFVKCILGLFYWNNREENNQQKQRRDCMKCHWAHVKGFWAKLTVNIQTGVRGPALIPASKQECIFLCFSGS